MTYVLDKKALKCEQQSAGSTAQKYKARGELPQFLKLRVMFQLINFIVLFKALIRANTIVRLESRLDTFSRRVVFKIS